jgi:response regulator NasT
MFSEEQDRGFIDKAVAAGVTAYLVGGVQPDKVKPVIDVAMAQFNIFQSLRKELDDTRLELEENQLIERAKRLLMLELNMDEASAYQAIRTQSMDCGLRRSDVAKKILQRHARNKGD